MVLLLLGTIVYVPLVLPMLLPYVEVDALEIARDMGLFLLLPLVVGLLFRWRFPELATRWQPGTARFSTYSLLLMLGAGLPVGIPKIVSTLGTLLIPATISLALGGAGVGWLLSWGREAGERKVMVLGTGQRNLAAALLVSGHSFGGDVFVSTLVACLVLTVTMGLVAAEWGRRTPDTVVEA
jgi:BASS family bile acid:Na+ symporter